MKILFLTPWYPDEKQPGHGIFIRDQVLAISGAGHEVRVIIAKVDYTRSGDFSYKRKLDSDQNITELHLDIASSFPVFNQINFLLICFRESLRVIQSFKPDVIHGNIGYPGAFWSWSVARYCGLPVVLTEHTLLHNNFRSKIHKWLTIKFIRKIDRVITVSQHSAAIIEKWTGVRAAVIPNMVDLSLFQDIHPFPDPKIIRIGFLGNGFRKKGLDTLLLALKEIKLPFKLIIGGLDVKENQHFRDMADKFGLKNQVDFTGFVSKNQVPDFMKQLHFFVSSSVFESFGVAIAEAMACGLPVVCTDSGGPADFVNSENGLLVPVGDNEALAEAIQKMCSSYDQYDRDAIRSSIVKLFSPEQIAAQIIQVYESVIREKAG